MLTRGSEMKEVFSTSRKNRKKVKKKKRKKRTKEKKENPKTKKKKQSKKKTHTLTQTQALLGKNVPYACIHHLSQEKGKKEDHVPSSVEVTFRPWNLHYCTVGT